MKKVTDLKENECIHFETKEQFEKILKLNPFNSVPFVFWEDNKEETVYYPFSYGKTGAYGSLNYAKSENHTIHKASEFLSEYPKEMYVSNTDPECREKKILLIDGEYKGEFVYKSCEGFYATYKYAKNIPTTTEYTIEQVIEIIAKYENKNINEIKIV